MSPGPRTSPLDRTASGPSLAAGVVIESFWGRMQTELLNRRRWNTLVELASAMFEYVKVFHNRQRRHSSIGMLTPIEYEKIHHTKTA